MPAESGKTTVRGAGWVALGLLLVLAGPAAYMLLFDVAVMRSTGAPVFALVSAGAAAALVGAWRDRRIWVRVLSLICVAGLPLCLYLFFVLARMPAAERAAALEVAPDFALLDHNGERTVLSELLTDGPVLLVFYRGHW